MLTAAGLAAALTGCAVGSDPAPVPTPTVSGPPVADDPPLPRLALRKLWSAPQRTRLTDILDATLVDGVLVAEGLVPNGSSAGLQAIELSSGRVLWSETTVADAVEKATKGARLFEAGSTVAGSGGAATVFANHLPGTVPERHRIVRFG